VLRDPETNTSWTPLDIVPVVPWTLCGGIWLDLMDYLANLSDLVTKKLVELGLENSLIWLITSVNSIRVSLHCSD
jgi:hypothetical protein